MLHPIQIFRSAAGRRLGALLLAALFGAVLLPSVASARIESLRWQETAPANVAGFRVYTRDTAGSYGVPAFDGLPTPDANGVYRFDLTLPDGQTIIAAVTAYDSAGLESALSNERQYNGLPPAPPPPTGAAAYRVNAGGAAYTDTAGNTWESDAAYATGGTAYYNSQIPVTGSPDGFLYQSNRVEQNPAASIRYEFPVADGTYLVRLHWLEFWGDLAIGQRVFDVDIEGNLVLDDFDLLASNPQWGIAQFREFTVSVSDGSLSVQFDDVVLYPMVSALEVETVSTSGGGGSTGGTGGSGGTGGTGGSGGTGGTGGTGGSGGTGGTGGTSPPAMGAPGQPQLILP